VAASLPAEQPIPSHVPTAQNNHTDVQWALPELKPLQWQIIVCVLIHWLNTVLQTAKKHTPLFSMLIKELENNFQDF